MSGLDIQALSSKGLKKVRKDIVSAIPTNDRSRVAETRYEPERVATEMNRGPRGS